MRRPIGMVTAVALALSAIFAVTAVAVTSGNPVSVKLNEFNVIPATQGAPMGKVTFTVKNTGKIEHEFVVIKTTSPAGSLIKGSATRASEAGAVGEIGSVKPGQTKKLTRTLASGHYALICNLPGHYKGGQFADFYVR